MIITREMLIKAFTDKLEYEQYNIAHLVLDDYNCDDDAIDFTLDYIDAHEEEYLKNNSEVTPVDIENVRSFLVRLLGVPDVE